MYTVITLYVSREYVVEEFVIIISGIATQTSLKSIKSIFFNLGKNPD